jgi:hypothetical protein
VVQRVSHGSSLLCKPDFRGDANALLRVPFWHSRLAMCGAQPPNVSGPIRVLLEQRVHFATLEARAGEPWSHGAAEQTVLATCVTGLPSVCWHGELHMLTRRKIWSEDHVLARAIWMKQDQAQRIARVKMPEFIVLQPVKAREAVRLMRVQSDDGGADRFARFRFLSRDIRAGEQRAFDW